jgi:hypothetical protein
MDGLIILKKFKTWDYGRISRLQKAVSIDGPMQAGYNLGPF